MVGNLRRAALGFAAALVTTAPEEGLAQRPDFDHEHGALAALMRSYVENGRVDYAGLRGERDALDRYTRSIAAVDSDALARFTRAEQLAYWLNAYNALVLATIVDRYPIKRGSFAGVAFPANSIRQVSGAFRSKRFIAGGQRVSLDDIEHRIVRPAFRDARVHMALVCVRYLPYDWTLNE